MANISQEELKMDKMDIESTAFKKGQPIPKKYTCEGVDVSPPITIRNVPSEAQSLTLIVDDPDAPMGTFDHWIAWNISPQTTALSEGAEVPNQGRNGFRDTRYRGPCPPSGKPHRYFFKLYALDTILSLPEGSSKAQVEKAMQGHILEKAEFYGTYQR
jgi:Raf kinase inhibitor-like YbhB/YbcL family protein